MTDEIRGDDVGKTFKSVFGFCYTLSWRWRYNITHPKTLSSAEAEEMGRRAAILHKQYGLKGDCKIRPLRQDPRAIEAMFGDLGPLPPPLSGPPHLDYSVNGLSSPAAKQWAKFHSTFDGSAVHLWGLWKCWPDITGRPGLAPAPKYPSASRLGKQAAAFEQCVARSRFRLFSFVEASPNRAAMIWSALEWLQYALLAGDEKRQPDSKGNPTVRKAAAFIRKRPGENASEIAKHCDIEPNSFRTHIAPELKKLGFTTRLGCTGGYYPPSSNSK
jgi:hypothetical protein